MLRQLPNALSVARILAAPLLAALALAGYETAFAWVLVPAMLPEWRADVRGVYWIVHARRGEDGWNGGSRPPFRPRGTACRAVPT
jgi:hypothetical protein